MSLRIVLALAVISGVTGDNNATTAPQTGAADGLAPLDGVLESAEKTQPPGEVRTGLEVQTTSEKGAWFKKTWIFVAIVISDLYKSSSKSVVFLSGCNCNKINVINIFQLGYDKSQFWTWVTAPQMNRVGRAKAKAWRSFSALPLVLLCGQLPRSFQILVDEFLLCGRQTRLIPAVFHGVLPFSL